MINWFSEDYMGFSTKVIMSSGLVAFVYCFLTTLAKLLVPLLGPDLGKNVQCFNILNMMLAVGLSYLASIRLRKFSSVSSWRKILLIRNGGGIFF